MTARMRHVRQSATDALRTLALRYGSVLIETPRPCVYAVGVGSPPTYFDAGTLEDALLRAMEREPGET